MTSINNVAPDDTTECVPTIPDTLTQSVFGIIIQNSQLNVKEGTIFMGALDSKKEFYEQVMWHVREQDLENRAHYFDMRELLEAAISEEEFKIAQCKLAEADEKCNRSSIYEIRCTRERIEFMKEYDAYKTYATMRERAHVDTFKALSSALSRN